MSDSNIEVVPAPLPEVPEEVINLQKTLDEFNTYHKTVLSGSFSGAQSKNAAKLVEHLYNMYKQVLAQLEAHPYVVDMKSRMHK